MARRVLVWKGLDEWRAESAEVTVDGDRLQARGTQIGADQGGYRLDYELETAERFVTARLSVRVEGEDRRLSLELTRSQDGEWRADGEPLDLDLGGALDCDLALSPLTNFMPIRRERGGPADHVMAWVSVPDLLVHRSEQCYEPLSDGRVRFSSPGFSADLELDEDGFVARYPGLAERV
jgi:uncharacterized protein